MKRIVLDCSVTMAWCFREEQTPFTLSLLDRVKEAGAVVPAIWPFEVLNTLAVAERRNRLDSPTSARFIELLSALPILIDPDLVWPPTPDFLETTRKYCLTAYDAAYLRLALRNEAPLATLDRALLTAAKKVGVEILKKPPPKKRSRD